MLNKFFYFLSEHLIVSIGGKKLPKVSEAMFLDFGQRLLIQNITSFYNIHNG